MDESKENEDASQAEVIDVLQRIAKGISSQTGTNFLDSLVDRLAAALELENSLVGTLEVDRKISTVSLTLNGSPHEGVSYPLDGAPCDAVIRDAQTCVHPSGAKDLFPDDETFQILGIESYIGAPLVGTDGQVLGILCAFSKEPITQPELARSIIEIFASRAALDLEAKLRTDELRRSEATQAAILSAIPDLLFRLDKESRFLDYKPASDFPTYVAPEEFLGKRLSEVFGGELGELAEKTIERVRDSGESERLEYRLGSGDESSSFEARFVRSADDEVLGIVRDITWLKQLESKMLHRQKLESLGVLAGGIAHDFNNLLQAVQGNLSILLEQTDELESKNTRSRLRRPLQKAFTATARASSLTRQLLAYSGRTRPSIRPTDLTEVVAETSELLELPATGKAKLVLELDRNLPPIPADRTQLQQVVMNLITNAVEAIDDPNTGRVRLRTSVESLASSDLDGDVLSSQLEPGRFVVVEVNDNGQGIPKDARSTMFDPFFTTKFTGRGLGLAAVQGIVRSHGGAILISSELSVGTTIRVALPLEAQPPASGSNSANPSSSGLSLRVLVADPSEIVRESSIMALESAGWFVSTASTPTELLDAMHRGELSTVVIASDLFDDPDTTWWLPLMEPSPRIRVFVTGEAESVPPVVRDRCSGILAKPYAPSDIISLVTSGPINN